MVAILNKNSSFSLDSVCQISLASHRGFLNQDTHHKDMLLKNSLLRDIPNRATILNVVNSKAILSRDSLSSNSKDTLKQNTVLSTTLIEKTRVNKKPYHSIYTCRKLYDLSLGIEAYQHFQHANINSSLTKSLIDALTAK